MHYLVVFNDSIVPMVTIISIAFLYNAVFKPNIKEISSLALNVFAPIIFVTTIVSGFTIPLIITLLK